MMKGAGSNTYVEAATWNLWSRSISLKHNNNNKEVHPPIHEYVHPQTHDCLGSFVVPYPMSFFQSIQNEDRFIHLWMAKI